MLPEITAYVTSWAGLTTIHAEEQLPCLESHRPSLGSEHEERS